MEDGGKGSQPRAYVRRLYDIQAQWCMGELFARFASHAEGEAGFTCSICLALAAESVRCRPEAKHWHCGAASLCPRSIFHTRTP